MKKALAIINMLVIIVVVAWNNYTAIYGFNGNEVGNVSDELNNLFTPAGYAFSIWGIIFIAILMQGIQILRLAFTKENSSIVEKISPSFIFANIMNCLWVYVWLSLMTGISTLVMSVLLIALILTAISIDKTEINESKLLSWTIATPVRIYLGWIIVATVANFSAYLNTTAFPRMIGELPWFYIMSIIATIVMVLLVVKKKWYEVPLVGIWSFIAIVVRHMNEEVSLAYFIMVCIVVLLASVIYTYSKRRKELALG